MYKVYGCVPGGSPFLIYSDIGIEDTYPAYNLKLTLEDNSAGSLKMTLPILNPGYTALTRMACEVYVLRGDTEIWRGRVVSDSYDLYRQRTVYCEGELSYLNDYILRQNTYYECTPALFLQYILTEYNQAYRNATWKQFQLGTVTVTDSSEALEDRYTDNDRALDVINDKLLDYLGGHLRVRWESGTRYLDYLADYPTTATQVIRFGENLTDFQREYDFTDFATVVVPLGKDLNGEICYKEFAPQDIGRFSGQDGYMTKTDGGNPVVTRYLNYNGSFEASVTGTTEGDAPNITASGQTSDGEPVTVDVAFSADVNGSTVLPTNVLSLRWYFYIYDRTDENSGRYLITGNHVKCACPVADGFSRFIFFDANEKFISESNDEEIVIPDGAAEMYINTSSTSFTLQVEDGLSYASGLRDSGIHPYVTPTYEADDKETWYQRTTYSNASAVATYGEIYTVKQWPRIKSPSKLASKAQTYIDNMRINDTSIEVSALDLSYLGAGAQAFNLLDRVRVVSEPHDLDSYFPITKITILIDKPEDTEYTLGKSVRHKISTITRRESKNNG